MEETDQAVNERPRLGFAYKRHMPLLLGMALMFLIGPNVSRYIETYRGVVLELHQDQMFLGFVTRPPRWVDLSIAGGASLSIGDIVQKEMGAWSLMVTPLRPGDHQLMQLSKRFNRAYQGVILRIDAPNRPQGASTALIECDDGKKIRLQLWATHLATAVAGMRVKKSPGHWDPYLVEQTDDAVTLQP